MARYLTGDQLHAAVRAGRGALVLVEGESDEDDAWYYNHWFAARATEVTFFAQNGWATVAHAVAELRGAHPLRRVYGLIDRDHATEAILAAQALGCPADGLFRTERFTLENHLLEPAVWADVLSLLHRGGAPSQEQVDAAITRTLRELAPLAAYNLALTRAREAGAQRDTTLLRARERIPADPTAALHALREAQELTVDLAQIFHAQVNHLQAAPREELHRHVSGKLALPQALRALGLQLRPDERRRTLALYTRLSPGPPSDLQALVSRLVDRAGAP